MIDNNIVKLAVDLANGRTEKYSKAEANKVMREALIDINGGSTTLDYKRMRDGAHNGLFALIEEVVPQTVMAGLQGDEIFNTLVEMHNVAEGDSPVFEVEDVNWYEISKIAPGVRGLRRQRLAGRKVVTLNAEMHGVRIYEHLRRILAGRVDFTDMIARVGESYRQNILNEIYTCWAGLTAEELGADFVYAGSYDEEAVLDVMEHAEAATGKKPIILGTAKALRNLELTGDNAEADIYNLGHVGKFYGADVIRMPQRHRVGTTNFIFPDNVLHVIATDAKPIKMVYEGNAIIKQTDALDNADMTQEWEYYDMYGMAFVAAANSGIGRIELA